MSSQVMSPVFSLISKVVTSKVVISKVITSKVIISKVITSKVNEGKLYFQYKKHLIRASKYKKVKGREREYYRGKYHCTIDLLFDLLGLACFANKNKTCELSYSWFQTSQTGGQLYSDTSPFSIPCQRYWAFLLSKASLIVQPTDGSSVSGGLWTVDLRIMSRKVYQCATGHNPPSSLACRRGRWWIKKFSNVPDASASVRTRRHSRRRSARKRTDAHATSSAGQISLQT
jgi:hypothetical protein